jgi:hypothetical protein
MSGMLWGTHRFVNRPDDRIDLSTPMDWIWKIVLTARGQSAATVKNSSGSTSQTPGRYIGRTT